MKGHDAPIKKHHFLSAISYTDLKKIYKKKFTMAYTGVLPVLARRKNLIGQLCDRYINE